MEKKIFENENFKLVEYSGRGIENTPYRALRVDSKGKAKKHVVSIDLQSDDHDFIGKPVHYHYYIDGTNVGHGMRCATDTLFETLEYAEVLKDAVLFAEKVNQWIDANREWKAL